MRTYSYHEIIIEDGIVETKRDTHLGYLHSILESYKYHKSFSEKMMNNGTVHYSRLHSKKPSPLGVKEGTL
ncbi:unnamed protein product [Malus baccata var. baccata]